MFGTFELLLTPIKIAAVCRQETTGERLNRFSRKLILRGFLKFAETFPVIVKSEQSNRRYPKTFTLFCTHLDDNCRNIYWSENCFGQKS
jgi:hypothetical protein